MKLEELTLTEAPIPDDWDQDIYDPRIPFAQRVRYAQERAQKLGSGSARVVFEIPYQGRSTVLKVAKNRKGMAQNDFESQMFGEYYVIGMGITIPMIDYDERSSSPTWIHTERALKATPNKFKQLSGGYTIDEVIGFVNRAIGRRGFPTISDELWDQMQEIYEDNDLLHGLVELVGNYDLPIGDFGRLANWGIYQNRLVIIDLGLSNDVMASHYS